MLKKIIKALLKSKSHSKHHYSSSDYKKKHYGQHPSSYGHGYYKKKHKSGGFFGKSYSSS
ncbi:hypothetical protein ACOI1C_11970 [Bacillus sp. DJP31]|uniref:hypothetical protein n=1 Tax=Bacillus sp. DJP31 TaxID=3409789 RepID=UPI003BB61A0B